MAFFPLKSLRVNKILISVIMPWKSLREPSYLHYLEKQQLLALENVEGGVSPCCWSWVLVLPVPTERFPDSQSLVVCLERGLCRLGCACRCQQLQHSPGSEQECFTIVLLGADKSSQAFYGQVRKVALGVLVIRRQSCGCRTQPYYL